MTKQDIIDAHNAHKIRQGLTEEQRNLLDNKLFDLSKYCSQYGLDEKIKSLLKQGADPNFYKEGKTFVHFLSCEETKLLELVVLYGGDLSLPTQKTDGLNDYNQLPLHFACNHGNLENTEFILEKLKEQGKLEQCVAAQTGRYLYTPRICASQGMGRQAMHALLDKFGVPHNIPDDNMMTELCWSASYDDVDAVSYLKQTGAKAITYDQNGKAHKASCTPQLSVPVRKILMAMEQNEQEVSLNK